MDEDEHADEEIDDYDRTEDDRLEEEGGWGDALERGIEDDEDKTFEEGTDADDDEDDDEEEED